MPRPRAHAPNKQGGKPTGQDTSGYNMYVARSFFTELQHIQNKRVKGLLVNITQKM